MSEYKIDWVHADYELLENLVNKDSSVISDMYGIHIKPYSRKELLGFLPQTISGILDGSISHTEGRGYVFYIESPSGGSVSIVTIPSEKIFDLKFVLGVFRLNFGNKCFLEGRGGCFLQREWCLDVLKENDKEVLKWQV